MRIEAMLERLEADLVATRLQVSKTLAHVRGVRSRLRTDDAALRAAEKVSSELAKESYLRAAVDRGDWPQAIAYRLQTRRGNVANATKEDYEDLAAGRIKRRKLLQRLRSK
jgi:hypothetical protein